MQATIQGAAELTRTISCFKLHKDLKKRLDEMGYICQGDFGDNGPGIASHTMEDQPENPLLENFYKRDNVLERHLSKDTLTCEYRIQFKEYSSEDDVATDLFNRAVHYESVSTFRRERKHKIDPNAAPELPQKRRPASLEEKMTKKGNVDSRKSSSSRKCKQREAAKKHGSEQDQ